MAAVVGDLVEVRTGKRTGLCGYVVDRNGSRVDIQPVEFNDKNEAVTKGRVAKGFHVLHIIVVPWPHQIAEHAEAFKAKRNDELLASNPQQAVEPSVRIVPAKAFGLTTRGWEH